MAKLLANDMSIIRLVRSRDLALIGQMMESASPDTITSALLCSVVYGNLETCQLLAPSASPDALNSALKRAAYHGNQDACSLLMKAGAIQRTDALLEAARGGHSQLAQLLVDSGARVTDEAVCAALSNDHVLLAFRLIQLRGGLVTRKNVLAAYNSCWPDPAVIDELLGMHQV